jgi:hypothetical protein
VRHLFLLLEKGRGQKEPAAPADYIRSGLSLFLLRVLCVQSRVPSQHQD